MNKDFSARLRSARARRGWVQADLARELNVSAGSVGNWESGQNTPSNRKLQQLADVLETTVGWLLSGEDVKADAGVPGRSPAWVADLEQRLSAQSESRSRRILSAFHAILDAVEPDSVPARMRSATTTLAPGMPATGDEKAISSVVIEHPQPQRSRVQVAADIEEKAALQRVLAKRNSGSTAGQQTPSQPSPTSGPKVHHPTAGPDDPGIRSSGNS